MKRSHKTAIPGERRSTRLSKKATPTSIDLTEETEPPEETPVIGDPPKEPEPEPENIRKAFGPSLPQLRKAFLSVLKGQDTTLNKLSNILYEFNANCQNMPTGEPMILPLLLAGVSGTGKTSSIDIMCSLYGMTRESETFVTRDMSDIVKEEDISKMLGSAPSFAGYGEKNFIDDLLFAIGNKGITTTKKTTTTTTAAKGRPSKNTKKSTFVISPNKTAPPETIIIHFEELDKAHHTVLTVLINFLETGRLISGNRKEFILPKETKMILVFTANYGMDEIAELSYLTDFHRAQAAIVDDMLYQKIQKPLIGRFPHILPYFPLEAAVTEQIATDSVTVLFEEVEFHYRDYFSKFSYRKESEPMLKKALSTYTNRADPELGMRSVKAICRELKRELCCETMFFVMNYMTDEKLPLEESPMLDVLTFSPDLLEESEYLEILERCQINTPTYHLIQNAWQKKTNLVLILVQYKERIMTSIVVHSEILGLEPVNNRNSLVIHHSSPTTESRKYCDVCGHLCKNYQRVRCPEMIGSKIRMVFKNYCNLCIYSNSIATQTRQLQPLLL